MESDQRRKVWVDPADGRVLLEAWAARWLPVQDVDPRTAENYESYLRCHVLARFGSRPVGEITALEVDALEDGGGRGGVCAGDGVELDEAAVDDFG